MNTTRIIVLLRLLMLPAKIGVLRRKWLYPLAILLAVSAAYFGLCRAVSGYFCPRRRGS